MDFFKKYKTESLVLFCEIIYFYLFFIMVRYSVKFLLMQLSSLSHPPPPPPGGAQALFPAGGGVGLQHLAVRVYIMTGIKSIACTHPLSLFQPRFLGVVVKGMERVLDYTRAVLEAYSWLYARRWLLAELEVPYGVAGIKPLSALCKASILPIALSLQPLQFVL